MNYKRRYSPSSPRSSNPGIVFPFGGVLIVLGRAPFLLAVGALFVRASGRMVRTPYEYARYQSADRRSQEESNPIILTNNNKILRY